MRRIALVSAVLVTGCLVLTSSRPAQAQEFSLQVGPPIAAGPQPGAGVQKKTTNAVFVVRPVGCADAAAARISATAEGLEGRARRTVPLVLQTTTTSGVHVVSKSWPVTGAWIVHLVGQCGAQTAGAIVTLGPGGTYRREGVQHVAGRPAPEQIERALASTLTNQPPATR
jgi:hypothetical protein